MDYSKLTLGELLSSENETIRRNAVAVLKTLQKNNYSLQYREGGRTLVGFNKRGGIVIDRIELE